ncbi:RodZ domain-containing protein [Glaciecola sp. 2405UD65-10]|uniref:RodZ domain-containing protein n=1 Tax=Glaciecola sp. 2405UD65-10 TaxID=3397244 RepID=UPI003B5A673B
MSNEEKEQIEAQSEPVQDTYSPGQQLRVSREKLGLSQQQVADRLHLRLASVQAVESDSLEEGVSVTFTKGYVRLYAKLVRIDVEPLLASYDQLHARESEPAKLQSFSRRVSREAHDHRWNMVSIVVVLLVLGSIIFWWVDREGYFVDSGAKVTQAWESLVGEGNEQEVQAPVEDKVSETPTDIVKQDVGPNIPEEDVAALSSDTQSVIADSADEASELASDTVDNAESTFENATDVVSSSLDNAIEEDAVEELEEPVKRNSADIVEGVFTDAGYRVNADGTVNVVFTFKDDCWVSVKDANGDTMAVGVKKQGRVMEVAGIAPVSVILGAPNAVEIDFGGQRIDMSVYPGGESAKFSLPVMSEL